MPDSTSGDEAETQLLQQILTSLAGVAEQSGRWYQQMLGQMQNAAVELALAVAGRLVHEKLEAGEFAVESLVRQVIQRLPDRPPLTIRLHPEDLVLLQNRLGDEADQYLVDANLKVVADHSLPRGSCHGEVQDVKIASEIHSHLEEIRQHLLWSITNAGPESNSFALPH